MHYLILCHNTVNGATTQWYNWDFNSVVEFQGKIIGAKSTGIFTIDQNGTDAGTDIDAKFRTPLNDFGIENQKRIRRVYISGEGEGDMLLIVRDDEDNAAEREFSMAGQIQKSYGVDIGRGSSDGAGKGRHFDFEVQNVNGADFSIDNMDAIPIIINRKP